MSEEKQQLKEILNKVQQAVVAQNWEQAQSYISENWVSFQSGKKVEWEDQKKMFEEHFSNHRSEFSQINFRVSDDASMAWATAKEQTEYMFDNQQIKEEALFTTIWEKENGSWKMLHLNRSVEPQNVGVS